MKVLKKIEADTYSKRFMFNTLGNPVQTRAVEEENWAVYIDFPTSLRDKDRHFTKDLAQGENPDKSIKEFNKILENLIKKFDDQLIKEARKAGFEFHS